MKIKKQWVVYCIVCSDEDGDGLAVVHGYFPIVIISCDGSQSYDSYSIYLENLEKTFTFNMRNSW